MASRTFHKIQTLGKEIKEIAGSFAPNSSSAVAATSRKGKGFTVARTSTGLFTVTLVNKFYDIIEAQATLQLATADDKYCQVGSIAATANAARTIQIRVMDVSGAAVADVSANANNRINFTIKCRNSKVL